MSQADGTHVEQDMFLLLKTEILKYPVALQPLHVDDRLRRLNSTVKTKSNPNYTVKIQEDPRFFLESNLYMVIV